MVADFAPPTFALTRQPAKLHDADVTAPAAHGLSRRQRQLLDKWLPAAVITRDHSWSLVGTTVLEVADGDRRPVL